jgi:hypothetical protein
MDALEMITLEEEPQVSTQDTNRIRLVIEEDEGPIPFVKFKPWCFEYKLESIAIYRKLITGEATEEDDLKFLMKMVADWDLKDAETGKPIPVGEYLRLTTIQIAQLSAAWAQYQNLLDDEVKKTRKRD